MRGRESLTVFSLPADFRERCARTDRAIEGDAALSYQQLADALGLPFEFVSAACAIAIALRRGAPVIIDPSAIPPAQ